MPPRPRMSHGILTLLLSQKEDLYEAYMPFVKGGGLFIETNRDFHLGEEVFALLQIMDEVDKTPITGKIIWMTPKSPQNGRKQGVGIQISNEDIDLSKKIETYLAGFDDGMATKTV
ncbi:MAG: PilZ domain-containing protein [Oceanospirillaceae bacterium]